MMKTILFVIMVFFVQSQFEGTHVTNLTVNNYDEQIQDGMWFVNHYAKWCEYCKQMEDDFSEAASALKGIVKFGAIEVEQEKVELVELYGVPSLRFYAKGQVRQYKGERKAKAMIQWILQVASQYSKIHRQTKLKVMARLGTKTFSNKFHKIKSEVERVGEILVEAVKETYSENKDRKSKDVLKRRSKRAVEEFEEEFESNQEDVDDNFKRGARKVRKATKNAYRKGKQILDEFESDGQTFGEEVKDKVHGSRRKANKGGR